MSWPTVPIEAIASVNGGKRLPKGHDFSTVPTDHPYIRARDIGSNRITFTEPVYITEQTFGSIKNYTVSEGDLVVTIVGANIGDVGYVTGDFDGANLTENAAKIRVNKILCDSKFLSLQLSTLRTKEKFQLLTGGSAQGKLGLYKIKAFDIILPPLPHQHHVASILSAYDDLIENNRRRIQLLEQAARLLYKEWFVHLRFPGHEHVKIKDGVPEGWAVGRLSDIVTKIGSGATPRGGAAAYQSEGITLIRSQNIYDYRFEDAGLAYINEVQAEKLTSVTVEPSDILLNITGASVGRCCMVPERHLPARVNQHVMIIRIDPKKCSTQYVLHFINSHQQKQLLLSIARAGGATREALTKDTVRNIPVLMPSAHIAGQFEENAERFFIQQQLLAAQNSKLLVARDLLLPRLMNGEISA